MLHFDTELVDILCDLWHEEHTDANREKLWRAIVIALHGYCTHNKDFITQSKLVGCFYCLEVYPASDITSADYLSKGEKTAFCSKCHVDSVIGDYQLPLSIDHKLLYDMHEYWFNAHLDQDGSKIKEC